MLQLTKGMYADLNCNLFGLRYNQMRSNDIIRNAGWFNINGEKIGCGDISLSDLNSISMEINNGELFAVLSETASIWNMPSYLDRNAPGIEYVMNNCSWAISGLSDTEGYIYHIKNINTTNTIYINTAEDSFDYFEIKPTDFFDVLNFNGKNFEQVNTPTFVQSVSISKHFGLDVYNLTDGTSWAIGTYNAALAAAKLNAQNWIWYYWNQGYDFVERFSLLNKENNSLIKKITTTYGNQSTFILTKLLGDMAVDYITDEIVSQKGLAELLAFADAKECLSEDILGLPKGFLAYRIA